MNFIKKYLPLALLLTSTCLHAQYTDQINSNRPGESMSGFAVGKTIFQVETGIYGIWEDHDILNYDAKGTGLDLQIRYGAFLEELEFVLDAQYQFDWYNNALQTYSRNDFKQFTVGAKYLIYDPDKNYNPEPNLYSWKANHKFRWRNLIPAVAVYGGINLVGGKSIYTFPQDEVSPKLMAITHHHFGKWVWVNNLIADKITTEYPSYGWISTLTHGFNDKWSAFGEFQGYDSDYYADAIFRLGAAHLLNDTMQIDASISKNFKDTPFLLYGGVGFSWRFDADYNDILLPGKAEYEEEKSKEEEKKEKKKDKKDKKKDRLDDFETGED
ncbi:transporter [Flavobacterium rakeshii]|uniref:Transporter n=1 Tax=Flavobacterium rakeshii TaxID=1038845 RepID=A0A6N8HCE8_9FLAO|nr:transporter [Flavobacterium rakeshii]MEE1898339.1 transporter [Flavobacterium rakeshii]MUV02896.1 transporter [Flavobacterium rakeshii]